jgi:hypothetical protein
LRAAALGQSGHANKLLVRLSVAGKRLLVKALLKVPDGKLLFHFLVDMVNS